MLRNHRNQTHMLDNGNQLFNIRSKVLYVESISKFLNEIKRPMLLARGSSNPKDNHSCLY